MQALHTEIDRPLYLQLVDILRREIAGKRPGERIDSEPALAERFGVSRFTVTRAVELLVDEGLIRRRQGLGSFVAPPPLRRRPSYLASFTQTVEAHGRLATHRLIAFEETEWREGLPYDRGEALIRLDRLRLVDNIPTALHASVLSAEIVRRIGLTRELAAAPRFSLYRLFAEAGLAAARGVETLRARAASPEEQRLLELDDARVVMEVARRTYDRAGSLVDFVHAVYDARRYAYEAEISADAKEDANAGKTNALNAFGRRLGPWGNGGGGG